MKLLDVKIKVKKFSMFHISTSISPRVGRPLYINLTCLTLHATRWLINIYETFCMYKYIYIRRKKIPTNIRDMDIAYIQLIIVTAYI